MRTWRKNWAVYYFIVWSLIAIFAPLLANESKAYQWLSPIIPYSATSIDYNNTNSVSPFDDQEVESIYFRHWLGTDQLGRDVAAQLIYGSRTAFIIGLGVVLLAGIIGIVLGGLAGYFGDNSLTVKKRPLVTSLILLPIYLLSITVLIPWEISSVSAPQKWSFAFLFTFLLIGIVMVTSVRSRQQKSNIPIPFDLIVSRIIELIDAIPLLFILVCLSAVIQPSFASTILIISAVAWISIAKYTRGEIIKVNNEKYIQSAKALALSNYQIIRKHILPNALAPVLVSLSFGMAAAILVEASLSFLGMGISSEEASWGKLVAAARNNYQAWWLAIFPGLAIFFTLLASNKLNELFRNNS